MTQSIQTTFAVQIVHATDANTYTAAKDSARKEVLTMDVREKLIDLKPCPFCGSKPFVWRTNHRTYIECPNLTANSHRVMISGKTDKEAIEAWNRRAGEEDKHETL